MFSSRPRMPKIFVVGLVVLFAAPAFAWAEDLIATAEELAARYEAQLEELAKWCDGRQMTEPARQTRQWLRQHDPNKIYIAVLPRDVGRAELPADTAAGVAEWEGRLWQLRRQQANALEALARKAVRADRAALGFSLVLAAIRENPDHEGIRRLLGYQKQRGSWHTLYEVERQKAGYVWHDRFGWIRREHVRRYEEGMRLAGGQWITAEEDARQHNDIMAGWDVQTEHYMIRTNHSLEGGVALGVKLERLHRVWKQLFVRYFATEAQVTELFNKQTPRRISLPKLRVVYFRDREDYNRALKPTFANIEMSIGVFEEGTRRAYFFAGKDSDDRTLYHEATHQLFHESRPVAPDVGRQNNFWIIEGIAMYMESLREEDGFHVLGGFDDLRMQAARYRLLNDNFYVPLSEFSTFGMQKLQADKRIATLYSQAAGLAHFLIHYENGRYRDALVAYLVAVYTGRDGPQTLSQLTGSSSAELDKQYARFMKQGGQDSPP